MEMTNASNGYEHRHPSTEHMMKMLEPNPNLPKHLRLIADDIYTLAHNLLDYDGARLEDSPEVTAGLRKLLEAKDCFVRAAVFGPTVDYRDR